MSTHEHGDAGVARDAIDRSKEMFEQSRVETAQQLELLGAPSPEAIAEARERLGPSAGRMTVLREARRGRPPGARNRRTDDYARMLLAHGRDPGITMIQIASTPPEVLMENSRRTVTKVLKDGRVVTFEETMSYAEAMSIIMRASEGAQPYINSKKPVAVDMNFSGVADLIISGVTHSDGEIADMLEGDYLDVPDDDAAPIDDGEAGA